MKIQTKKMNHIIMNNNYKKETLKEIDLISEEIMKEEDTI